MVPKHLGPPVSIPASTGTPQNPSPASYFLFYYWSSSTFPYGFHFVCLCFLCVDLLWLKGLDSIQTNSHTLNSNSNAAFIHERHFKNVALSRLLCYSVHSNYYALQHCIDPIHMFFIFLCACVCVCVCVPLC